MEKSYQINLSQITKIIFYPKKVNNGFSYHTDIRKKYIFFGKEIKEEYWIEELLGPHFQYSRKDITDIRRFMLIGNIVYYKPYIKIYFSDNDYLKYYFEKDDDAKEIYDKILKELSEKCPMCDIKQICSPFNYNESSENFK